MMRECSESFAFLFVESSSFFFQKSLSNRNFILCPDRGQDPVLQDHLAHDHARALIRALLAVLARVPRVARALLAVAPVLLKGFSFFIFIRLSLIYLLVKR